MNRRSQWAWALLLLLPSPLSAQEPRRRPFSEDTHAFRFILHAQGLRPVQALEELNEDAQQTLFIVLGTTEFLTALPEPGLRGFLRDGGALLLATDRETVPLVGELLGAHVTETIASAQEPLNRYRGLADCPMISVGNPLFPPFRDIGADEKKVIATNRPSRLIGVRRPANAPKLASVYAAVYPEELPGWSDNFALVFLPDRNDPAGGQRSVLLADHSVFINSMMLQNDNGNFRFAQGLVRWLTNDGGRKKALFVDDGVVQGRFEVLPADIPDPTKLPPQRLPVPPVEVLNQVLASWQDDDIFNRLILERFSLNQILSGLALWLSVAFIVYGLLRLRRSRYLQDVHP